MSIKKNLARLRVDSRLERGLNAVVWKKLIHRAGTLRGYAYQWEKRLSQKPSHMAWVDYIRLRIWHRQFQGKLNPGLPTLVRTARFFIKEFQRRFA